MTGRGTGRAWQHRPYGAAAPPSSPGLPPRAAGGPAPHGLLARRHRGPAARPGRRHGHRPGGRPPGGSAAHAEPHRRGRAPPVRPGGRRPGGFERLPPRRGRGCCHEYTVGTPGSADRGARRVVTGRGGERYSTDAPCASFRTVLG
ncbi:ribonuclease domain-containing protein [Streptomyces pratens]|uniref:Ribonuclease domain-containing protein n=1 Tax=Streptomyces pratens TaxID=887456 RepID=A0ABW1M301_9ACTN